MTELYVKDGDTYRVAGRTDVSHWFAETVAAELPGTLIASPADSESFLVTALQAAPAELFAVIYLNTRHAVLKFEIAFRGTIDNTTVYPREIVRRSIELNAAAVIFAHNHPSGVATPSDADRIITHRLRTALELVDVRVLDHFVVTASGKCSSLAALGMM